MKLFRKAASRAQFDEWISTHHTALYRHALWMTGNRDVAAEMVQEAFYQAWVAMDSLKESDKALPWLLTILRRAIYREQRYQYRHTETMNHLSELVTGKTDDEPQRLLLIYRALENLSANHRDVVLLHYLQGFSYEEISEQLQVPKGTVMSRLSRARQVLAELAIAAGDGNVVQLDNVRSEKHTDER
ncbi:MAG TPA: RNA polymerase sigma factor [Gammaproteobacteria bacterium]|nr:RNA polymerase sigma factor [Gammaproteobacteria bacterium]